jgi:hypothetical protein
MSNQALVMLSLVAISAGCSHGRGSHPATVHDGGVVADAASSSIDSSADGPNSCTPGTIDAECMTNADCDDGNPATVDTCQLGGGEFPTGTCLHAACDGGLSCVAAPVDPNCLVADMGDVYPPFVALYPPDVPASCANGFQLTNATATLVYTVYANTPAGSQMLNLDLDIATYEESDGVEITGVDGNCKKYTLFDTCHLKTADDSQTAYTNGMERPQDVAIRQYHLDLRPGTSQLSFNFGNVRSPMYIQVLGLCDFTLTTPPATSVEWYAPVP